MNIMLDGFFKLQSPLSHIGETISVSSYLNEESILQPDGTVEKVFVYNGNAWRGQLRDLMASYMLDKLHRPSLTNDAFHLLFSGGKIGGAQSVDLEKARWMRRAIPLVALLGGGVGNQILSGKLRVGGCYPLCAEAAPALPFSLRTVAAQISYADLTQEKQYSRRDDAKIDAIAQYLPAPKTLAVEGAKSRRDDGPADQMRIRSELLVAGTQLRTWIRGADLSDVEMGCLVSALHRFAGAPFIGGQSARGHGLVDLEYTCRDLDTNEVVAFFSTSNGDADLAPVAQRAKDAYDTHLKSLYDEMLASNADAITALLGAA